MLYLFLIYKLISYTTLKNKLLFQIVLENYLKDSDFGPKWISRSADYPYGFELVFYPFLVGPAVEALWSFFSDWRFLAIPGALIRIAGGWFVFSYYTYLLWDWYYREQSV
jgi:hypothetical protein